MDNKILNLFSFLNNKEGVLTNKILRVLTTTDEFKKFKNIPKKTLDILICKYGFNSDNKEIVDYLKSLGGSDDFFKNVKEWMDKIFKDLSKELTPNTLRFNYISQNGKILITDDKDHDYTHINYDDVYLVFKNKFGKHLSSYIYSLSIFKEYFINYLDIEVVNMGTHHQELFNLDD